MHRNYELRQWLMILRRHCRIIVSCVTISTLIAFLLSAFLISDIYEARTVLYVSTEQNDGNVGERYDEILLNTMLAKDYKEIAMSERVTDRVLEELQITDITHEQLSSKVEVTQMKDTRLIAITVRDNSPTEASQIANKIAQVFTITVKEMLGITNIKTVVEARIPLSTHKPLDIVTNTFVGLFLGLLLGITIVVIRQCFDRSISTIADVKAHLDLPIIGKVSAFEKDDLT